MRGVITKEMQVWTLATMAKQAENILVTEMLKAEL